MIVAVRTPLFTIEEEPTTDVPLTIRKKENALSSVPILPIRFRGMVLTTLDVDSRLSIGILTSKRLVFMNRVQVPVVDYFLQVCHCNYLVQ